MTGSADPLAAVPTECRNGEPGYAGPNAYDLTCEFPYYICPACHREAEGR